MSKPKFRVYFISSIVTSLEKIMLALLIYSKITIVVLVQQRLWVDETRELIDKTTAVL